MNLRSSIERRLQRLDELERLPELRQIELELCRRDEQHWFDHWAWTYDPRAASGAGLADGAIAYMPFDLFERQQELVKWLSERLAKSNDGLVEKSRDIGFTWVCGGYALHKWRFASGFKTTFGSRKEEYVDRIGDPDSIFEKIRMLLYNQPRWMLPRGFDRKKHDNSMRIINPENGNTIRGEAGDEMGRGGRSTLYIIDEAAFIEHAERVEASTSANTNVRIWGSTVNGPGNFFHRKRFSGQLEADQIFRFHYTDDPRKTPEWAEKKRKSLETHVWASEYDIDYSASVEGICIPAKWVDAARRIRQVLSDRGIVLEPAAVGTAGLDVGAGGKAKSVFCAKLGPIVLEPEAWGDPDTAETANRALDAVEKLDITRSDGVRCRLSALRFDEVGVGKGVLSALSTSERQHIITVPVNVGVTPSDTNWPDGLTSEEKFVNIKAEIWFKAREAFKCTYEYELFLTGGNGGQEHPLSEIIALPGGPEGEKLASQLSLVKWFRNEKGKIIMESKTQLATRGIASPDHAEAFVLNFCSDGDLEVWEKLGAVS